MTENEDKIQHLAELLILVLDGSARQEHYTRLNEMLRRSEVHRRIYMEFMTTYVGLNSLDRIFNLHDSDISDFDSKVWQALAMAEKTAPAIDIPKQEPPQELIKKVVYQKSPARRSKIKLFTALLSAAALIFLIVYARYASMRETTSIKVATFVDQINVKWADSNTNFQAGSYLWTNDPPLYLEKGIVKIRYDQGVDVLVEGPALFEIERSGIFLKYGRLYSRVSQTGLGFTVDTPTSRFIDLGTEFGVKSDIDNSSELHVMKGKVQLFAGTDTGSKSSQIISENKAVRYNANSDLIQTIPVEKTAFVCQIDSKTGIIWRRQMRINLADIVGGGNGFGSGLIGHGIDITNGKRVSQLTTENRPGSGHYVRIDWSEFIDGVFVPDGGDGPVTVSSRGHQFVLCPDTEGLYWVEISNGGMLSDIAENTPSQFSLRGMPCGTSDTPAIFMHSNSGISFNLNAIRAKLPGVEIARFSAIAGISENGPKRMPFADFWVLVDGKVRFNKTGVNGSKTYDIEVALTKEDQFLTLMVTDGGHQVCYNIDGQDFPIHADWGLFVEPQLTIQPE